MDKIKRIALVAHDNRKRDLKEWVEYNYRTLVRCNRSTADFMISSPLMNESYEPVTKDYKEYINRKLP